MTDKTWKAAERQIAKWFPGAKRRGSDFRGEHAGKSDLILPGYSVEIKSLSSPSYGKVVAAVEQARTNRETEQDIPLAVIHKVGDRYADALVVMSLKDFSEFFISQGPE